MTTKRKQNRHRNSIFSELKYVLCALLVVAFIGCMIPATTSYAFEGTERADDNSAFKSEYEQNRYKIWSILRAYGLSEYQAVGIIANIDLEGGMFGYKLEGDHEVSEGGSPGAEKAVYFTTNHDAYTVALMKYYGLTDEDIEEARSDYAMSVYSPTLKHNINAGYYFTGGGSLHTGFCGIGIFQWTGENAEQYMKWCEDHSYTWYAVDAQLAWLFAPADEGGSAWFEECIADFLDETKSSSDIGECAGAWCKYYERPSDIEQAMAQRSEHANEIYHEFKGKGWDGKFGEDILSGVGIKAFYYEDGIVDVGIIPSFSSVTLIYPQNNGFLLETDKRAMLEKNGKTVYEGFVKRLDGETDDSPTYSLYELFGEDIHWYRYLGEETYYPKLFDHIYSAYAQDKLGKLSLGDTIFYDNTNYLSCSVYADRPVVLSQGDIFNGSEDPRVSALSLGRFNGYAYELGSLNLSLAKYVTSFVTFLNGDTILTKITDTITDLETTDFWKAFSPIIMLLLSLGALMFIISIFSMGMKYAAGQSGGSLREIFGRLIIGLLCMGILIFSVYNPSATNEIVKKALSGVDYVFDAALATVFEDDEVIAVHDVSQIENAALWKTAIFGPWCRGQFEGRDYKEVYTQYAVLEDGQKAMPQSNQTIDQADKTGQAYYNSTKYTGDVYVPVGGGKDIRNWAAYLYSCGSPYHIDSLVETDEFRQPKVNFPMANTTYGDPSLLADTFRVIDAQMDISPQHYADGTISYNYEEAHGLDPHFIRESITAIFNSLCLLMLIPAIFIKLKSFFLLIFLAIQMVYYSVLELFKAGNGLDDFGKNVKKNFFDYLVAKIRIYIMIVLYVQFVDKGFILALVYLCLCLVVYGFNVQDAKRFVSNTKHNIQRIKSSI